MVGSGEIVVDGIHKVFKKGKPDEVRAVDGISFTINKGELFGLLGPNGAGKTTLIKCISTLLIPDSGSVKVGGYDIYREPLDVRRHIGVLTGGERSLYWKLNPVENLRYFAALYGVPRKITKERIEYLLDLMGLTDKTRVRVEKLSSGMKQKLSLARVLIHDPPILLVDEPTLGLDPYFARFIRDFVKNELNRKLNKTILLTTHYMDEADDLCERIAFMNRGKIEALDTPERLKQSMPQKQVLEIKCQGTLEREMFSSIEGAASINISHGDGFAYLRLNTDNPEIILGNIIELVRENAKIYSVRVTVPTLEDVFVHLTGASLKDG
ncbi:MAG: ABC transporter ATP-binding protein [candidate division WOR-3 bacterium]|nr:MAG: ABC transporter ATP-binding protein [candidate division WOR-3 bacterium]